MGVGDWVKQIARGGSQARSRGAEEAARAPLALPPPDRDPEDTARAEAERRWIGFIDRVTQTAIEGWALDADNPSTHVMIEAVTSQGERSVALAHLRRDDVAAAGHGDGCYGFFLDLSRLNLKNESLVVRFSESKHPITRQPIELDAERAVFVTDLPRGYLDCMQNLARQVLQAAELAEIGDGRPW